MEYLKTYIQQTAKSGDVYTKGSVVDILSTYHVGTEDFPLVYLPETKALPTHSWNDEDGEDVYIPKDRKTEAYDMNVKFLYSGKQADFRSDIESFINFLYGRNTDAVGSRLVIYDDHVKDGRKDITVKSVSSELFHWLDEDDNVVAEFGVTFRVHDPATKVTKVINDKTITLTW